MPALSEACTWYLDYLESKIKEEWITLLRPVLSDIEDIAHFPSERDIAVAFSFLSAVVMELKCVDVALTDICDFVYNEDLLKYTDSNRTEATQLIFTVVGWISMQLIFLILHFLTSSQQACIPRNQSRTRSFLKSRVRSLKDVRPVQRLDTNVCNIAFRQIADYTWKIGEISLCIHFS